jgi:hypothetical protein
MPLRHRIRANPETVQDLVLASDEKYWEGIELLTVGKQGAGIYLLGYAAEMILKNACFLTDAARPGDLVGPRLGPIQKWANRHLPNIPYESYHSLRFWLCVLQEKRRLLGRPLPYLFNAKISQRIHRVYGLWIVDMRYKPDDALQREAEAVYNDVTWLRDQRLQLVH